MSEISPETSPPTAAPTWSATEARPDELATSGLLVTAFRLLAVGEVVLQVVLLVLLVAGIVSADIVSTGAVFFAVALPMYGLFFVGHRILGTLLMVRTAGNLRRLGVRGLSATWVSPVVFWLPLLTRGLWVIPYVLFPEAWWAHGVWLMVLGVALFGGMLIHEIWRASRPDQLENWRKGPVEGLAIGWAVATVVDAATPMVQPWGILATMVLVSRLGDRVQDKAVVVREVGLPRDAATATPDGLDPVPLSAGSA